MKLEKTKKNDKTKFKDGMPKKSVKTKKKKTKLNAKCPYCDFTIKQKHELGHHITEEHNKEIKCKRFQICDFKPNKWEVMKAHKAAGHKELEANCEKCDMTYSNFYRAQVQEKVPWGIRRKPSLRGMYLQCLWNQPLEETPWHCS